MLCPSGTYCNSASACFVASDGKNLRLYQAVVDARKLLDELSDPETSVSGHTHTRHCTGKKIWCLIRASLQWILYTWVFMCYTIFKPFCHKGPQIVSKAGLWAAVLGADPSFTDIKLLLESIFSTPMSFLLMPFWCCLYLWMLPNIKQQSTSSASQISHILGKVSMLRIKQNLFLPNCKSYYAIYLHHSSLLHW